jgi:hypothetical protein
MWFAHVLAHDVLQASQPRPGRSLADDDEEETIVDDKPAGSRGGDDADDDDEEETTDLNEPGAQKEQADD